MLTAVGALAELFVAVDSVADDLQGDHHVFLLALQDGAQQRVLSSQSERAWNHMMLIS